MSKKTGSPSSNNKMSALCFLFFYAILRFEATLMCYIIGLRTSHCLPLLIYFQCLYNAPYSLQLHQAQK